MLFLKHLTSMQLLPRLSLSNLTWDPVVLIFQNNISLTLIISGVFIRVVGTLYKPVLAVCDIPTAVSERILGRHKLVSEKRKIVGVSVQCSQDDRHQPSLEAGEDAVAVGVEEHLQSHRAPGRDHGARGWSVAVSETKYCYLDIMTKRLPLYHHPPPTISTWLLQFFLSCQIWVLCEDTFWLSSHYLNVNYLLFFWVFCFLISSREPLRLRL